MSQSTSAAVAADPTDPQMTPTPEPGPTPTPQEPAEPGAQAQEPAPAEASTTEGDPASKPRPAAPAPAPKPKVKDWREQRISETSAQNRILQRQLAEAQAALKAAQELRSATTTVDAQGQPIQPQAPQPRPAGPQADPAYIEQQVAIRAAQQAFNAECNKVESAGVSEYPDFNQRIAEFSQIGGLPTSVIEAMLELQAEDPQIKVHSLLYDLAGDLDSAIRIARLSPSRMGVALAKLASSAPVRQASQAPEPPGKPLRGPAVRGAVDPDQMPYADWLKWREANAAPKGKKLPTA